MVTLNMLRNCSGTFVSEKLGGQTKPAVNSNVVIRATGRSIFGVFGNWTVEVEVVIVRLGIFGRCG